MHRITNLQKNITISFSDHGFYWYHSKYFETIEILVYLSTSGYPGNHSGNHFETSGAYVFRPLISQALPVSTTRTISCTKSKTVQSALIVYNDWASEEITIFNRTSTVEFEWTVGAIPIDDRFGKEIILRYDTDIASASKFYTDANGREVLERIRDFRPTWNYTLYENVSGNYYPVNSRIWIKDQQRQLTILTGKIQNSCHKHCGTI